MNQDLHPHTSRPRRVPGRVVVGTDGSPDSRAAVELAADEAWRRGTALHVLAVVEPARGSGLDLSSVLRLRRSARLEAEAARSAGVSAALSRCAGLYVTAAVVPASDDAGADQAVRARDELEGAALLVVGPRGRRGVPAFAMGTTSGVLAAVSTCPVLVTAPGPSTRAPVVPADLGKPRPAPVVACVDDRRPEPVLAAAAVEASGGRSLEVVHVTDGRQPVEKVRARLQDLVRATVPGTTSTAVRVVTGEVVPQVLEAAARACVVVIGSRGTLALAGLALGSISHEVLRDSPVPVLVARQTDERTPSRARQQAGTG